MTIALSSSILAILVVTVINFIIGWLWYGPLFGRQWTSAVGISRRELDYDKKKGMAGKMMGAFVLSLVTSYVTAIFIKASGASTVLSGAFVGVLIWLGFFMTTSLGAVIWEHKKKSLFYINACYDLVRFIIIGAILAIWL